MYQQVPWKISVLVMLFLLTFTTATMIGSYGGYDSLGFGIPTVMSGVLLVAIVINSTVDSD